MKTPLLAATAAFAFISLLSPSLAQSSPKAAEHGQAASARDKPYASLIASHAASNGIPAELVHRVIMRESRYRAAAVGRGGASGLMQVKLSTARAMGYSGSAAGLLDPATNLTYGVRYLAGAYRAARGHHGRTIVYYASGYRGAGLPARTYLRAPVQSATLTTLSATGAPVAVDGQTQNAASSR